jgi:RecB family exonuclease
MLKTVACSGAAEKDKLFSAFDPRTQSWVVSDLQSKWHLQKTLLARHGTLADGAVLRATELWKHFAFQLRPDLRLISPELAQTLFWDWIEPMRLPWARSPRAVTVVLQQMQMWMTLFSDPQSSEIMAQWFADNPASFVRWGHWFELCTELWHRCRERRLMMAAWLPAMLLNEDLSRLHWPRALTFDLGPQISQVEGLLLRELGAREHANVRVLYPEVPWSRLMRGALRPYEAVVERSVVGGESWQPTRNEDLHFGRFSTQLAEVKDAVARVRGWLQQGVPAAHIALVAPDIEEYWPVIKLYLRQEGIPVRKAHGARLGSFSEMARWLATLRTTLSRVSSEDLEVHFFTRQDQPRLGFEQFRVLFTHVYDALDLDRARALFESRTPIAEQEPQSLQDFLLWALRFWEASAETSRLQYLLQVLGQEVPRELLLKPTQWLSYIEGLLARREMTVQPANEQGVWCISLSSANWLDVSHCVTMNMSEGALRRVETSQVGASEAQKIFVDTGFALGDPDRQELEFELLWLLRRPWRELHLTFAGTDFAGNVLTPSRLWMWAGFVNDKWKKDPQIPLVTRWDEIQRQPLPSLAELRKWKSEQRDGLATGLMRDLDAGISTWKAEPETRLSASALEKYMECPFAFAAQRKLKLGDEPALDLDLDRRTRGHLLHALAEELLLDPPRWDWNDDDLNGLVDRVRAQKGIQLGDERLWPMVRRQHVKLARLFLRFEREWRERFPQTQTVGRESEFTCYWDFSAGAPTAEPSAIVFTGRLDRIDRDSRGRYALIDYKASAQELRNWSSWLKNKDLQMALYAMLLEAGLCGLPAGAVAAANYYVIRDRDRRKGFHVKEADSELYSSEDKHRNWIGEADKATLFSELRQLIQEVVRGILAGELNPNPADEKLCVRCSWRVLCRAPHLN